MLDETQVGLGISEALTNRVQCVPLLFVVILAPGVIRFVKLFKALGN